MITTKYLFDASSIINLIKRGVVKPFANGVTIDLAVYETLNAVWKEYKLQRRLSEDVAYRLIDILLKIFNILEVKSIRGLEKEIFRLACEENITVYDASYLYAAIRNGYVLVTDDKKLIEVAKKYVKVLTSDQLSAQ